MKKGVTLAICTIYDTSHAWNFFCTQALTQSTSASWAMQKPQKSKGKFLLGDFKEIKKLGILSYLHRVHQEVSSDIAQLDIPFSPLFVKRHYAVFDPSLAKDILYNENKVFKKGDAAKDFIKRVFSPEGILFLENGARWEGLHKILSEGQLNPKNFLWLISRWKKNPKPQRDLYQEITFYTMRTMAQAFFNYTMTNDELHEIVPAFKYILDFIQERKIKAVKTPYKIPTRKNKKFKKYIYQFHLLLRKIVKFDPETITIEGIKYKTLIKKLHDFKDKSERVLNDDEILSHMGTLFFAGHDTIANLITMLIYKLEQHKSLKKICAKNFITNFMAAQSIGFQWGVCHFMSDFKRKY